MELKNKKFILAGFGLVAVMSLTACNNSKSTNNIDKILSPVVETTPVEPEPEPPVVEKPYYGPGFRLFNASSAAQPALHDQDLWVSDGTETGTIMLKPNTRIARLGSWTWVNKTKKGYFLGEDDTNGHELWVTDGTAAGTKIVKQMGAGAVNGQSSNFNTPYPVIDGKVYFLSITTGFNNVGGGNYTNARIYVTDGTDAGTQEAVNIGTYTTSSGSVLAAAQLIALKDRLLVGLSFANGEQKLYVLDEPNATLVELAAIPAQFYAGQISAELASFQFKDSVFIKHSNGRLYKTDFTQAGTVAVTGINDIQYGIYVTDDKILFKGDIEVGSIYNRVMAEVLEDGTLQRYYFANAPQGFSFTPKGVTVIGNKLYFLNDSDNKSYVLDTVTKQLTELTDGAKQAGTLYNSMRRTNVIEDAIVFEGRATKDNTAALPSSDPDCKGYELWSVDLKTNTVDILKDIALPSRSSSATCPSSNPVFLGGISNTQTLFTAFDGDSGSDPHGRELWITDGTEDGTKLVKDIAPGSPNGARFTIF